jgi:hypothetical protein
MSLLVVRGLGGCVTAYERKRRRGRSGRRIWESEHLMHGSSTPPGITIDWLVTGKRTSDNYRIHSDMRFAKYPLNENN